MKAHRKGGKKQKQSKQPQEKKRGDEFDFKREKKLANKVFSLGQNKKQHRE